jgi:tetratricopeptide (TPR) repeat protein
MVGTKWESMTDKSSSSITNHGIGPTMQSVTNNSDDDVNKKEQQAVALIKQGQLLKAEALLRGLIATGTVNHTVYGNLAAICGMQGRFDELLVLIKKTLKLNPSNPEAHNNLGILLHNQGKHNAAITSYQKAIQLKPDFSEAHNNLGNSLKKQGDLITAIASYKKAIHFRADFPEAYSNLGIIFQEQGDLMASIASYEKAIQLNINFLDAHYNLGNALKEQGELNAAIASYHTVLRLKPNFPEAYNNLGATHQLQGNLTAAITSYNRALKLKPNYPDALNNLGNTLKEKGEIKAAINSYSKALGIKPDYPEACNNLGIAFKEKGDLTAAIASFNQALRLNPNYPEAHANLGNTLHEQGNLTEASISYKKSLELNPDNPEVHVNYSLTMLLLGDYKNGWEEYTWRTKITSNSSIRLALKSLKLWHGESLKHESKLLLVTEQGLGDILQFMRYALALRCQKLNVSLCAQSRLHPLIQSSGIDSSPLTPEKANQVTEGQWMPLLSVPRQLKVSPSNPIINKPYIKSSTELNKKWKAILSAKPKPTIGINWRGNRNDTSRLSRNIPAHTFSKITGALSGHFLYLQRDAHHSEIEEITFSQKLTPDQLDVLRIVDSDKPGDFLEYAAIISNCDLVITTGSTVAHLAGGIGIPTWVLLPDVPDWRWGLEGETTFWYPSMRLFRQRKRGNWYEVIERVIVALQEQFGKRSMPSQSD